MKSSLHLRAWVQVLREISAYNVEQCLDLEYPGKKQGRRKSSLSSVKTYKHIGHFEHQPEEAVEGNLSQIAPHCPPAGDAY